MLRDTLTVPTLQGIDESRVDAESDCDLWTLTLALTILRVTVIIAFCLTIYGLKNATTTFVVTKNGIETYTKMRRILSPPVVEMFVPALVKNYISNARDCRVGPLSSEIEVSGRNAFMVL